MRAGLLMALIAALALTLGAVLGFLFEQATQATPTSEQSQDLLEP